MKALKKLWSVITTLVVVAAVLLAIALVGVRLVGIQPMTVLSGSMEPAYHVGSLIFVKKVDYRELKVGDPITFLLDEDTVATHRIVEIVPDDENPSILRFRTKGDANEAEDGSLVHFMNIVGKPVFSLPLLGYVANFIQNPPGRYIAIAAVAVIILLIFLPDLVKVFRKEEKKPDKEKDNTDVTDNANKQASAGKGGKD